MSVRPVMALPFLGAMLLLALLYGAGKKKYAAYITALDKGVPLRDFLPVGFELMALLRYGYGGNLDRRLRRNLAELHEWEYVEFYLRVIWAQAATYAFAGLWLSALMFAAMDGDPAVLVFGAVFSGALAYAGLHTVEQKVAQRHLEVAMELPNLTNQILILSGAGLTLRGALIKIAREMPAEGPLYTALAAAVNQMENGATDEQALGLLAVRCNMPTVRRFVSALLQNMQRGGAEVISALREIGKELWDERKAAARQLAERTTTKLLFPMMLMLFAVILLMAAPAIMSMSI